jgi:hypothetical protein
LQSGGTADAVAQQLPLALVRVEHDARRRRSPPVSTSARTTGARAKLGAAEPVLEPHRQFAHARITECACDSEELEVEREALDEQQRHDVVHDPAAEDLQPDLSVVDVEPERAAGSAAGSTSSRFDASADSGRSIRVALRADREVQLVAARDLEELRDRRRVRSRSASTSATHSP